MPKYTLTYFDVAGRGQITRHLFSLGGIEFEDKRVGGESWMAIKPDAPLKQLPTLAVEGMDTMCQSSSIERYVAKLCGLTGGTDTEQATVDQVHTTLGDMATMAAPYFFGELSKDEVKKEELRVSLLEKYPVFFDFLTRKLVANGGGDGFIVGSSVTLADVCLANCMAFLKNLDKEDKLSGAYPKIFALVARVNDLPAIKEFNAKHVK